MSNKSTFKTFAEIGVIFTVREDCVTCLDESCHNTVPHKKTGEEFFVHISKEPDNSVFRVHGSKNSNTTDSDDIDEEFDSEFKAVQFVCETFNGFNCF